MRLLFIDDSDDDVLLAKDSLRREGLVFEERSVATIADAAAALAEGPWSAVISDYNLGPHNGLDALGLVRSRDAEVPFILLSGTIGEERAAEAIREGASDYVMKDRLGRLAGAVRREVAAAEARSAQQRLELQLQKAEERYRTTFERAPIGIGNLGHDGCFINVNEQFRKLLGYEEHEMVGQPLWRFVHPDDHESANSIYERFANRDNVPRYERRYIRKDGRVVWTTVTVSTVRNAEGEPEYLIGLVEDITEQKAAREKLLLQSRLLECVEQAIVATDLQGRVTYWNRYAETLYGWSEDEARGRIITDVIPVVEKGRGDAILAGVARGASWSGDLRVRTRRDGAIFPAWVIIAPLFDDNDTLIGAVGVSHDLTQLKHAEDELRAHKVQLAAAQDMARVGSWTYDYATGERQWSDSFARIYGFPPGVAPTIEATLERVRPDDRARLRNIYERAQPTQPVFDEFRIVTDEGERVMAMQFQKICDSSGAPARGFGVVQDITESKRLEEELRRRTIQQSAVANLGQLALSGASMNFLLEQAVDSVQAILGLEYTGVLRKSGDDAVIVAGAQWNAAEGKAPMRALAVPIRSADGAEWGILAGSSHHARPAVPSDSDFLRSVAIVIGQALDRAAADAELRTRARQQSVIATLGRLVLTSLDDTVYTEVCELLKTSIGADYTVLAELTEGGMIQMRAGTWWGDEPPAPAAVRANTQAGYAILKGEPVVVDDYRSEERFDTTRMTVKYGVLSGAMMPIASAARTFGVLSAQSRKARHFRQEDVDFLQSLANVLADAMERDLAQRAVETSENRYRRIFGGATEIIYTIDSEGRIITLNPAFETITGWSAEEWIGRPFAALIVPEERDSLAKIFTDMMTRRSTAQLEATVDGRDRQVILEVTSFPQVVDGRVAEIYGFARDVTDARRTVAERERVTRSLELLLESTVEGIYTIDMDGRCTMVNRSAASFLGVAPEELIGVTVHDILHATRSDGTPNPIETCPVHGVLEDGEPVSISNDVFTRKDGTQIPVAYSVAPINDRGERVGAVVTFMDQTERRKLEARLEQANRLSSLGRLAATVAHEFNNVLMGIAPFVEVVRRSPSQQKVQSSLDHITSSVKRGRRITEDILRFTQPAVPALSPLDVRRWLESVASEAQSLLASDYKVTIDAQPLCIDADASQLHQILTNLLLNARDAMPLGGTISIDARRESPDARFTFGALEDPSRFAHFTIRDTGSGMPEETLQHAFEPLFTTKKNGTGLGLAVTHQVVQRHGGEIFVESTVGAGTAFHIFIPLSNEIAMSIAEGAGEQPHAFDARHILLVEDDPTVSAGISTLLEDEGFVVTVAETGRAALAFVEHQRPDAVVLDVGLPDLDGRVVYTELVALHPGLPVIFSTGHADRGRLEVLLSNENVGFLLKPYEYDELTEALSQVMTR